MLKSYLVLLMAIVFETVATSFLKQSEQFTKFWPSVVTVAGYAAAFYCLSLVLKHIPVGIAYAIWSGVGIVLIAVIGFTVFKQHLDWPAVLGLALIIAGVVVINVFSVQKLVGYFRKLLQNAHASYMKERTISMKEKWTRLSIYAGAPIHLPPV